MRLQARPDWQVIAEALLGNPVSLKPLTKVRSSI
jgi:hypothetical protein